MSDERDDESGISRRRFLVGSGVVAAATAVTFEGHAQQARPRILGPKKVQIDLRVNGSVHQVEVAPSATLAQVLRDQLHLTGTKIGCDRGACSACTVLLENTPVVACTVFALDAAGKSVTTVEGLAQGDNLHPVQQSFIDCDAMQCGFCTPGMVMSCAALLARNASPTLDDVRAATSGNLCRCGTYENVFQATLAASRMTVSKKG